MWHFFNYQIAKVDHILGPEGGVAEEADCSITLRYWVHTGLHNEMQLVCDQSLAVEQGCAASVADGPVGEVEHMDDLLGQAADVPLLAEQLHTPLFGHTLQLLQ